MVKQFRIYTEKGRGLATMPERIQNFLFKV
jgi:hypothetical protein